MHARPRALRRNLRYRNGVGSGLIDITVPATTITLVSDRKTAIGSVKPMAWAEEWDAALLMAPLWGWGSVAPWPSAMPMLLQWLWL